MKIRGHWSTRRAVGALLVLVLGAVFFHLGRDVYYAHQLDQQAVALKDELSSSGLALTTHLFGGGDASAAERIAKRYEALVEQVAGGETFDDSQELELELGALATHVRQFLETEPPAISPGPGDGPELALLTRIGRVTLSLSDRAAQANRLIETTSRRLGLALVGFLLLMIAGAILISTRTSRQVLPRTRALNAALKEMEKGRWPAKVEVREDDEIGELAATFNAVAVERRRVEEELRQVHEELEERVARRTRDLARTNQALGQEVTERRRAENALRKSEQYFRRIFEEGPLGMGVFDAGGRLVKVNATLAGMLHTTPEEMVGRSLSDYRSPDDPEEDAKAAGKVYRGLVPSVQTELGVVRRDGVVRRFQTTTAPIQDEDERLVYGLLMVEDITDRLRAEELLVESERYVATGRMAARIAHEINNPLGGIKNAFRLIKDSVPLDHPHHSYVGRIDREIDRLAGIVRQMYGIYRPESRGLHHFRATAVIEDVVALITAGGPHEDAPRIELDIAEAEVTLNQLDGMLRQVLHNLLQNAIEASPRDRPVRVCARTEGDSLVIEVSDRGEGIEERDRGRIFEPFYTTKEGREDCGLGLGLAISLRAAEAMGGRLEMSSEAGVGSTFVLTVPLDAERAARDPSTLTPPR